MANTSLTKRILQILAVLIVLGAIGAYLSLRSMGIIPRAVYETEPPLLPNFTRPAMLVLNKTNGFVHRDAIPAADAMLQKIAEQQDWDIFITDNAATHNARDLARFALVVWNNTSGDILTESQRADFKAWVESGGGWIGLHAAGGDPAYQWDWYVKSLLGAQFIGHTMFEQFRDADVLVVDPKLAITGHLPPVWRIGHEEWYAFDRNPREQGYEILLVADESSYMDESEGRGSVFPFHMEGEHPLVWRHTLGRGRVFYSAIGHQAESYSIAEYQILITRAMLWAMSTAQELTSSSVE